MTAELVVLLGDDGRAVGTMPKSEVHTSETPLHLAFSCHLRDAAGRELVTRRALGKRAWPGVWTNAFCGHPGPGESLEGALVRRARQELGAEVADVRLALPDFRYRAVDASGVVENEVCPVLTATLVGSLDPDPGEVAEWRWMDRDDLADVARRAPHLLSPWAVRQIAELSARQDMQDDEPPVVREHVPAALGRRGA